MTSVPFGHNVWLWRLERGLTQEALARRARMARPNLSAIEAGKREVSLRTLRALAVGLGVQPGILVDGVSPLSRDAKSTGLSRQALERVADAVARKRPVRDRHERALATMLQQVVRHRARAAATRRGGARRGKRAAAAAWLLLESGYPREVVRSLVQRIVDRQRVGDGPTAD